MSLRLNVYIAGGSGYSRRKADTLILEGKVTVNNTVVRTPYYRVNAADTVCIGNQKITSEKRVYLALNKPAGYTCTCSDRYADKKVTDILPVDLKQVYPVGRLDKDSRGLLLLTNDGNFCQRVTHPRFSVEKEYVVLVSPPLSEQELRQLRDHKGMRIHKEHYHLNDVRVISSNQEKSLLSVTASEGKKRHVRVIFSTLGHRVIDLRRVRIGKIDLGTLKEGHYRFLTEKEVEYFKQNKSEARNSKLETNPNVRRS